MFNGNGTISDPSKAFVDPKKTLDFVHSAYDSFEAPPGFLVAANGQTNNGDFSQNQGLVLKQYFDESGFEEWAITYSDRLRPCLNQEHFIGFLPVAFDQKAIYLLPKCNTVVRIRRSDPCAAFLEFPRFERFDPDIDTFRDLIIRNEQLIVTGLDGYYVRDGLEQHGLDSCFQRLNYGS